MRQKVSAFFLLLLLALYLPLPSTAWGVTGHRVVGQIADSYINTKTRAAIKRILGTESIAMSSNWADFIKSDSAYKYLDPWHYVNTPKDLSYEAFKATLAKDTNANVYNAINFLVKELKKKNLALDSQRKYLRLLIHFVGDIHQPLHVSPEGTTGGNDIKVQWFRDNSNLHRVWDSDLIEMQQLSYTEYAAYINHSTAAQRSKLQSTPLSAWLYESYVMAQDLHNEIKEVNPRLGYRYNYDHIHQLNQQMLKGGVRLAGLLNQIFGK